MRTVAQQARNGVAGSTILLLAGCGTFQLASSVIPSTPKTQDQQQLDNLGCKDQAKLEANTTGRQTGAFLLGMTIVGAPVAFEMEKAKQREVYKSCMEAKGYRILPPNDQAASAAPASNTPSTPQPALTPPAPLPKSAVVAPASPPTAAAPATRQTSSGKDEAAQLQILKELRDKGLITEEEYEKKRKEILDRL